MLILALLPVLSASTPEIILHYGFGAERSLDSDNVINGFDPSFFTDTTDVFRYVKPRNVYGRTWFDRSSRKIKDYHDGETIVLSNFMISCDQIKRYDGIIQPPAPYEAFMHNEHTKRIENPSTWTCATRNFSILPQQGYTSYIIRSSR